MLQHYEILYLVPGTKTEEELPALTQQVHELMTKGGAVITHQDFWGKRKLAYEIDHIRYGYYEAVQFDLESTKLPELESVLRLFNQVLRFQILRRKVLTAEQQAAAAQLRERIAAKREVAKEKEAAAMLKPEPVAPEPVAVQPAPLEQKALDEKLEEILGSDKLDI